MNQNRNSNNKNINRSAKQNFENKHQSNDDILIKENKKAIPNAERIEKLIDSINNDYQNNSLSKVNKECLLELIDSEYVEISFKGNRKEIFRNDSCILVKLFAMVVVEIDSGLDVGKIVALGDTAKSRMRCQYKNEKPKYSIIRLATDDDQEKLKIKRTDEITVVDKTKELVDFYKLDMKVIEAEWQFDRQRLTVYFTAPQRIDFRDLVKELARTFRTRIELRQISTREETKRIGCGIGCCGLTLCCTSFLKDFAHVTLDHARTQQLSNNVTKLSGYCGRLKCCLLYEFDNYVEVFEKYPPLNSFIETKEGIAKILKVDVFKDIIYLYNKDAGKYGTISYPELEEYVKQGKVFQPDNQDDSKSDEDYHLLENGII